MMRSDPSLLLNYMIVLAAQILGLLVGEKSLLHSIPLPATGLLIHLITSTIDEERGRLYGEDSLVSI